MDPKIFKVRLSAPLFSKTKSSAVVEPIIAVAAATSMRPSKLEKEDGRGLGGDCEWECSM